jgi:hypothetical protein
MNLPEYLEPSALLEMLLDGEQAKDLKIVDVRDSDFERPIKVYVKNLS